MAEVVESDFRQACSVLQRVKVPCQLRRVVRVT